ncbi:MAG: hypothetical protein HY774_08115 [Acidobacteria bacterium]|nr:hypothetical protein [Acidobacteriota bacterium]
MTPTELFFVGEDDFLHLQNLAGEQLTCVTSRGTMKDDKLGSQLLLWILAIVLAGCSGKLNNNSTDKVNEAKVNREYKINKTCDTCKDINITKVAVKDNETIITLKCENTNRQPQFFGVYPPGHKEAFYLIKVDNSQKFQLLNIDGVGIRPQWSTIRPQETLNFTLTFERIEDSMRRFHLIEGEIEGDQSTVNCHFLNVELKP